MKKITVFICLITCILTSNTVYSQIVSISPDTITLGQTLDIEITAENIDFTQGTPSNSVKIEQGGIIKYLSNSVISSNKIKVHHSFSSDYPTGDYNLTVYNYGSGKTITKQNAIFIKPDLSVPFLHGINNNYAKQGEKVTTRIFASNTNFSQRYNTVHLNNGVSSIYPNSINIINDSTMDVTFQISFSNQTGSYKLFVQNDIDGTMSFENAFTVDLGVVLSPKIVSITPDTITLGQTLDINITAENINFTQGTGTATNIVKITQGSVTKTLSNSTISSNQLKVSQSFTSDYPTGNYDMTITNSASGTSFSKTNALYIKSNTGTIEPVTKAKGFDMSGGEFYSKIDSLITTDFAKEDAISFCYLKTIEQMKEHSFNVNGSTVSFHYANTNIGKWAFRIYDDCLQPNGTDRIMKISNVKAGDTITLTCLDFEYDVTFKATNAVDTSYSLPVNSAGARKLTIIATDTVVTLVNTVGKYKLQKVTIGKEDTITKPKPCIDCIGSAIGFDITSGGVYSDFDSLITTDFAIEDIIESSFYYLNTVESAKEHYFNVNGSTVSFLYGNSLTGKQAFKIYDNYLAPNGDDRILKVSNLAVGDTITLAFKPWYYDVIFEATNTKETSYTLNNATIGDSILTVIATDSVVTLVNISGKYQIQKVIINDTAPIKPRPNYNLSDTSIYYVSDINFQAASPHICHKYTDSLIAKVGGGDSIVSHYTKFVYLANHFTDTITVTDTITIVDSIIRTDTITVVDTITIQNPITIKDTVIINDTIEINKYISVTDTLVITKQISTELSEVNNNVTVKIYPNPAKEYVIINVDEYEKINDYYLTISNISGHTVYASLVNKKEHSIDIQDIGGKGLYFITFKDSKNNTFLTKKLIVQ